MRVDVARFAVVGAVVMGLCLPGVAYGGQEAPGNSAGAEVAAPAVAVPSKAKAIPAKVKKVCDTVAWYASAGNGKPCLTNLINATKPCKPAAKQSRVQYGVGEDKGEYYIAFCMTTYDGSGMWYGHSWLREYDAWMTSERRAAVEAPVVPEGGTAATSTAVDMQRRDIAPDLADATWKVFMTYVASQKSSSAYTKAVRLWSLSFYREAFNNLVSIVVDPEMKDAGVYTCGTYEVRIPKDPRGSLTTGERESLGETVWHELTHAIEDRHGDCGALDTYMYQERHVDYMSQVNWKALPKLERMESYAREGRSVGAVRAMWLDFINEMEWAYIRSGMGVYPKSMANLMPWFGFSVHVERIRKHYASGKALKGAAGTLLKRAVSAEPPDPEDVGGTDWTVYDWFTGSWRQVSIVQLGTRVVVVVPYKDYDTGGEAGATTMELTIKEQPEDAPANSIAYATGTFTYEGDPDRNPMDCAKGRINLWFENFSWQIFGANYCGGELSGNFRWYHS